MKAAFFAALLLLVLAAIAVCPSNDGLCSSAPPELPSYSVSDLCSVRLQSHELEQLVTRMRHFEETLRRTETELVNAETSLEEAVAVVLEAARRNNPQFMTWLQGGAGGLSPAERVKQVLLQRLRVLRTLGRLQPTELESVECLLSEHETAVTAP